MHYYSYYPSPIGVLEIITTSTGVVSTLFLEATDSVGENSPNPPEILTSAVKQFDEYFNGIRKDFTLKCEPDGTLFQRNVWSELLKIPYGKTWSYKELATALGNDKMSRAVGKANSKNRISIIIPCHRVIGTNNSLTGYAGGLERKEWLLAHEKKHSGFSPQVFSPGCALLIHNPSLAEKAHQYLNQSLGVIDLLSTCCRHEPKLSPGTEIVTICSGCERRFRELYKELTTISFWEILVNSTDFPFPDYGGKEMSILDTCPTRDQSRIHNAVRELLSRMNIKVIEPKNTKKKGTCCGDSFYGEIPTEQVITQMKKRGNEMPCEEVVVYCVSCIKSMHIAGKKPRFLADLLFNEETTPGTFSPEEWHQQLEDFIEDH